MSSTKLLPFTKLLFIEKDKEIERLRKGDNQDSKSCISEDETTSQGSRLSMPSHSDSVMEAGANMFNSLSDQYTMDYLRNIFSKYLVYIAKKKEKKAKTWENILFTLLNIPEDQIKQINKARK